MDEALTKLAEKLNTTVEHLWNVLVYQARIEAIQDICFILFAAALSWLTVRYWQWAAQAQVENEEAVFIGGALGTSAVAIFVIAAVFYLFNLPTLLSNHE